MFSAFKPFLVTIAMISFLMIIGNFLSLQTGVYGSASISRKHMAPLQPLSLLDPLSPNPQLDYNINNYNIYGIKHTSVDWVNSVQPKTTENTSKYTVLNQTHLDKTTKLLIRIIAPVQNSTYVSKEITVNGSAFSRDNDYNNNIHKVEVSYHHDTHNKTYPYRLAEPFVERNWTYSSIKLNFNVTGYYRILARVTDEAGNQEWDSVTTHIPFLSEPNREDSNKLANYANSDNGINFDKPKVAIVQNTFTEAAYSPHGFYSFYNKYTLLQKMHE